MNPIQRVSVTSTRMGSSLPNIPPDLGSKVSSREIDWRQEVLKQWGEDWAKPDVAYRMSNGRQFDCTDLYRQGVYTPTQVETFTVLPIDGITNVELSTLTTSNPTNNPFNSIQAISISGGSYSINGGAFTTATGTINPTDTFRVRGTSSSS